MIKEIDTWSCFECEYILSKNKTEKTISFYYGDFTTENVDYITDWRFKEVKDKRKQIKLLGVVQTKFPIEYPLVLNNGLVIQKEDYKNYTEIFKIKN